MDNIQKQFCKKISWADEARQSHTILGIIVSEDDYFIRLKTRRRELAISKKYIVSISDTQQEFEEDKEDDEQRYNYS